MLKPFPFLPVSELTREAVKSYVDAQKALMDVMVKAPNGAKAAGTAQSQANEEGCSSRRLRGGLSAR